MSQPDSSATGHAPASDIPVADATGSRTAFVVSGPAVGNPASPPRGDDRTSFCAIIVDHSRIARLTSQVTAILTSIAHVEDLVFRDFYLLQWVTTSTTQALHVLGGAAGDKSNPDDSNAGDSTTESPRRAGYLALIEALADSAVGQVVMSTTTGSQFREADLRILADMVGDTITLRHSTIDDDPLLAVGYALDRALRS